MVLIVAIAVGLALCRTTLSSFLPSPPPGLLNADAFTRLRDSLPYVVTFLATCTIACLVIRLRPPRPAFGRIFDSPGMAAVTAATLVLVLEFATMILLIVSGTRSNFVGSPIGFGHITEPGSAVAGAWSVLCMGGRWTFERSWVDWLGFGLGIGWVGVTLVWWGGFVLLR